MAEEPLVLEVWSDIVCPWCWIGHARLKRALAEEPAGSVVVRPRAFELRPDTPVEGRTIEEAYHAKFGGPEGAAKIFERVTAEGARDGLELRYDRMRRAPNSRVGHRLVALAAREGLALEALDALFVAHFREGEDIGDPAVAAAVVVRATGLDAGLLGAAIAAGDGLDEVLADEARARELEIQGVPCFVAPVVGVGISGAQEPALLRRLIAAARERAATAAA